MIRKFIISLKKLIYELLVTIEKMVIPEEENELSYHEDVFLGNYDHYDINLENITVKEFTYKEEVWIDEEGNEYKDKPERIFFTENNSKYNTYYKQVIITRFCSELLLDFQFNERVLTLQTTIPLNAVETRLALLEHKNTYLYVKKNKDLEVYFNNSNNHDNTIENLYLIDLRFINKDGIDLEKLRLNRV